MDSKLKYFKNKIVIITTRVRTNGTIFATGGYFVDYDDQFIYLAPEDRIVNTSVAISAVLDITITTEEELQQVAEKVNSEIEGMN
jgi:hypothetical protein